MKLYTEEQVRWAFRNGHIYAHLNEVDENEFIGELVPIELPSDEEIESNAVLTYRGKDLNEQRANNNLIIAFEVGAKCVIDKIKNQQ